jgi:hypothetical protein
LLEEVLALARRQDSSYQHISSFLELIDNRIEWALRENASNSLGLSPNALMAGNLGSRIYPNATNNYNNLARLANLNPIYNSGLGGGLIEPLPHSDLSESEVIFKPTAKTTSDDDNLD